MERVNIVSNARCFLHIIYYDMNQNKNTLFIISTRLIQESKVRNITHIIILYYISTKNNAKSEHFLIELIYEPIHCQFLRLLSLIHLFQNVNLYLFHNTTTRKQFSKKTRTNHASKRVDKNVWKREKLSTGRYLWINKFQFRAQISPAKIYLNFACVWPIFRVQFFFISPLNNL